MQRRKLSHRSRLAALSSQSSPTPDLPATFAGRHHARYIEENVPVHVISRAFQGRMLLRPGPELNSIVIGVIGHALELYDSIKLYALAVLSNHAHLMLSGRPDQVSAFVGFVKREISRRWGRPEHIDWPGAMWEESCFTALPTAHSQQHCLEYILAHGAKEHLVERPQDWPGVHCAQALLDGSALRGRWLNATFFGRAVRAEARKLAQHRQEIRRSDYEDEYEVYLCPIPAWRRLSKLERRSRIAHMLAEIVRSAHQARGGEPVVGIEQLLQTSSAARHKLPHPPWFEKRRRMICWADPKAEETRAYLKRYWDFQRAFKEASRRLRAGEQDVVFPPGAFRPLTYTPLQRAA